MTQKKLWEEEIPNWLEILDRLEEVNKIDADNYFISDIENDYKELSLEGFRMPGEWESQKNHIPKDMAFFVKLNERKFLEFNWFVTAFIFEVQN